MNSRIVAVASLSCPAKTVTVFVGLCSFCVATATMREFIQQAPSSPSYALFKGRDLVYFMPREFIEGKDINDIAMDLKDAFDENCK